MKICEEIDIFRKNFRAKFCFPAEKCVSVIQFKSHSWVAADMILIDIGDGSSGTYNKLCTQCI